jgi:glycerol-3-phosphate cytidylyltransferase-like family protein
MDIVAALRCVDEVFLEEPSNSSAATQSSTGASILAMGDDKFDEFGDICRVVYFDRTPAVSTTGHREVPAGARCWPSRATHLAVAFPSA